LPTGILLNTFVERKTPVIAPNGESSSIKPRLPSVKENLSLMAGMAATQVPKSRLDTANKKPTASTGFKGNKLLKFLNSTQQI
jgi:hypothetical protein